MRRWLLNWEIRMGQVWISAAALALVGIALETLGASHPAWFGLFGYIVAVIVPPARRKA